jgi:hypothetical protein
MSRGHRRLLNQGDSHFDIGSKVTDKQNGRRA